MFPSSHTPKPASYKCSKLSGWIAGYLLLCEQGNGIGLHLCISHCSWCIEEKYSKKGLFLVYVLQLLCSVMQLLCSVLSFCLVCCMSCEMCCSLCAVWCSFLQVMHSVAPMQCTAAHMQSTAAPVQCTAASVQCHKTNLEIIQGINHPSQVFMFVQLITHTFHQNHLITN